MPQLDTSTWFMTIFLMIFTIYGIFQLKVVKYLPTVLPTSSTQATPVTKLTPWNSKWTKIYLPHSLLLQS
uniref:ATP synthase complex subunit 8 n=1 Tax=Zaglossus bruijni TaxID=33543 RepID=Q5ZNA6_ZAGBR|nr:ATP synthase F0 subunit 8 [Zaglossus bruijni]CAG26333.1 ATP synthase F0 subunit 8 [Zaglossus bruijni]